MSEETTHNVPDGRSFEERVFACFDSIDAGLRDLNSRVQRLENESGRRTADAKAIWERALAEIVAAGEKVEALTERVYKVEQKPDVFCEDVLALRSDRRTLRKRMDKLEAKPTS